MQCIWPIERYSRCYSDTRKQYTDQDGNPLYTLLPTIQSQMYNYSQVPSQMLTPSQTQTSPAHHSLQNIINSGNWTSMQTNEDVGIEIQLTIKGTQQVSLKIKINHLDKQYLMENIEWPLINHGQFKISPKRSSLGFRYILDNQQQHLFQLIFKDEFSCRLCYDHLGRFGLLHVVWDDLFSFDFGMKVEETVQEGERNKYPHESEKVPDGAVKVPDSDETVLGDHQIDNIIVQLADKTLECNKNEESMEEIEQNRPPQQECILLSSEPDRTHAESIILQSQEKAKRRIIMQGIYNIQEDFCEDDFSFLTPCSLQSP